jgi:FAD synthetase
MSLLEALTSKYIVYAEKVLVELKKNQTPINLTEENVASVLGWVTDYLEDAKYYKAQGKLETSLTSIAYCEGLLEALRLIGAVNFEWPSNQENKKLS